MTVRRIQEALDIAGEALDDPDRITPATVALAQTILVCGAIGEAATLIETRLESIRWLLDLAVGRITR